jgi:hydrogenase maturation protein HypF
MAPLRCDASPIARRRWTITGQVQGVGFRPFVHRQAAQLGLLGRVRNTPAGVSIECQGRQDLLDRFIERVRCNAPALAQVSGVEAEDAPLQSGETGFSIVQSADGEPCAAVTPDAACCGACAAEVMSATDRRSGYGLTNCTDCGPRYTIVKRVPYDRANTTMAGFEMCSACGREYRDNHDRRFHAEPIACPVCGPRVELVDPHGRMLGPDPIDAAVELLRAGRILAIKGLGGFHLAVRADDKPAVHRLRSLKRRDAKPLALMCRSIRAARQLVVLSDRAAQVMQSPACPIVLAQRIHDGVVAANVAPGSQRLGVMLPYTPIHHLLFARGPDLPPLVMTSGNISDEPLVIDNAECVARLGDMCDGILWHDRPIQRAVDDSILIDMGEEDAPLLVRRARGLVPSPIRLPVAVPEQGLCAGADMKGAIAVVRQGEAILGHHLGDLAHPLALAGFRANVDDLCNLFGVRPRWVAHDLHPGYFSTREARHIAEKLNVSAIAVQHHHAHAAGVLAEHGLAGPALAVVCDGTGHGPDGTIWGGELLAADLTSFKRLGRLRPLRLPGGDASAKETRRSALALLWNAWGGSLRHMPIASRLVPDAEQRGMLCGMLDRSINCAASSGAGRLFDAVAAILGLCDRNRFEAEAAMALEAAAARFGRIERDEPLLATLTRSPLLQIDLSPLACSIVRRLGEGVSREELAALFHEHLARAWDAVVAEAADSTGLKSVALSGGVFCNAILTRRLTALLERRGLRVLRHTLVPPNDGGIALGQAAVASARLAAGVT